MLPTALSPKVNSVSFSHYVSHWRWQYNIMRIIVFITCENSSDGNIIGESDAVTMTRGALCQQQQRRQRHKHSVCTSYGTDTHLYVRYLQLARAKEAWPTTYYSQIARSCCVRVRLFLVHVPSHSIRIPYIWRQHNWVELCADRSQSVHNV